MSSSSPPPPSLQEATRLSTTAWQKDLQSLFFHAKDRFPDVVWELISDDDRPTNPEEVWGHKAIIYARAPPSFQARYFSLRPQNSTSPYCSSPNGNYLAASGLSLPISGLDVPAISRSPSPSPYRSASPAATLATGTALRLTTSINSTLFSNELEYLYTGKGFGEAFEFLFDSSESRDEGDAEEQRIDKLRKDLVFMWRSRLYSDVRIALTGTFSSTNHETSTAIFSTHRFLLISRSPYFHSALLSWGTPKTNAQQTLELPSPPFTPASLHFTLGFLYTGTLVFSNRTYDLETAFHILRSASYLSLDTLYNEVQARIVQEMMHGLFHAFLEFKEYEVVTDGKWGTGGCRCRQCARRTPRILEFASSSDVRNTYLERGAKRALVGLFGEGWCNSEFALLDQKFRDGAIKGLAKRTTPDNIFALLFAAHHGINKLASVIDAWADIPRDMIMTARKHIDQVLCLEVEKCFEQHDWLCIMENDGAGFDDAERVAWVMDSIRRGLSDTCAPMVYQVLVSSILLRPHPTENDAAMLSPTSHIRVQVEEARLDILKWIGKRWIGIRQEGGFNDLEGWSLKEISHDIDIPIEDLLNPQAAGAPPSVTSTPSKNGLRKSRLEVESDNTSVVSLRATLLKGSVGRRSITPTHRETTLASSGASVRSVARSVASTASRASTSTVGTARRGRAPPSLRPDSKLTPATSRPVSSSPTSPSVSDGAFHTAANTPAATNKRLTTLSTTSSRLSTRTPSVHSAKSHASTIRSGRSTTAGPSTLKPRTTSTSSRRSVSATSNKSDNSTQFNTAASEAQTESTQFKTASEARSVSTSRARKTSAVSTTSSISVKTTGTTPIRPRRASNASGTPSLNPRGAADPTKLSPSMTSRRPTSRASTRSTATATSYKTSTTTTQKGPILKPALGAEKKVPVPTAQITPKPSKAVTSLKKTPQPRTSDEKSEVSSSAGSASTIRRKASTETITKKTPKAKDLGAEVVTSPAPPPVPLKDIQPSSLKDPLPSAAQGSTLDIGIPCIISLKRKRFKAFARYIGEVAGEQGPWVGVEVPLTESFSGDKIEASQWTDGSWGGVRYFDVGAGGSEWEFGDDRATRRRRVDMSSSGTLGDKGKISSLKREGDGTSRLDRFKRMRSVSPAPSDASCMDSRGLFVRPQQVLYVVDAVGADL